jgi:hypothetical protein
MTLRNLVWCSLALGAASVAAWGQSVISARSGLVHYIEGQVYLGDHPIDGKFGNFPEVKENQQLRTAEGRAEVLLTPGVFLRLAENSSFRMITNRLIDTRLEFLSGEAIVEADDIGKDNSVTMVYKDAAVHVAKKGIYRFNSQPGELRVYDGEAQVTAGDKTVEVKEGHVMALDTLAITKFDKSVSDALNRWSSRRAEYISMANVSAARSLSTGGALYGNSFSSGWYFNPYFGMYTFVPGMNEGYYSPYGYRFFSPFDVYMAYLPYYYPSGGGSVYNGAVGNRAVAVHAPSRIAGPGVVFRSAPAYRGGFGRSSGIGSTSVGRSSSSGGIQHR